MFLLKVLLASLLGLGRDKTQDMLLYTAGLSNTTAKQTIAVSVDALMLSDLSGRILAVIISEQLMIICLCVPHVIDAWIMAIIAKEATNSLIQTRVTASTDTANAGNVKHYYIDNIMNLKGFKNENSAGD